jgi:DNA-binding response OmpR family regulator
MKALLVSDSPQLKHAIQESYGFQNTEVIHYDNPIKAMDNLDEIQPEVVLFAATDYPRHWKPFIAYLRNTFTRRETVFVLLISDSFSAEEAEKAEYLEVNAVVTDAGSDDQTVERIRGIVTRYHQKLDIRSAVRYMPSQRDIIRLVFTNPYTFRIVTGRVLDISTGGINLLPDRADESDRLDLYAVVTSASLRLGEEIVPVKLKVARASEAVAFEYIDIALDTEQRIGSYLNGLIARERDIPGEFLEN